MSVGKDRRTDSRSLAVVEYLVDCLLVADVVSTYRSEIKQPAFHSRWNVECPRRALSLHHSASLGVAKHIIEVLAVHMFFAGDLIWRPSQYVFEYSVNQA
ncbi:hypothetical protein A5625_25785 [Mycobacterium sp. 1465703.0]|nr:hypothetical protein A5625_25785 [Mycobacterium sp. 1465703.0]